jgi:hypothetical protein
VPSFATIAAGLKLCARGGISCAQSHDFARLDRQLEVGDRFRTDMLLQAGDGHARRPAEIPALISV